MIIILENKSNGFALHIEDAPTYPGKKRLSWQNPGGLISAMLFSIEELEELRKYLNVAHKERRIN